MVAVVGENDKIASRTSSIGCHGSNNNNARSIFRGSKPMPLLAPPPPPPPPPSSFFILLQIVVLIGMIAVAAADNDEECVCSPRQFYFKLNLSASCPVLPPPFPPNDVFGAGVKDYTCSIGLEPVQNDAGEFTLDEEEFVEPSGEDEDDSAGERNVVTNSNDDSITAAASSASLFAASQSTTSNHDSSGQRRRRRRHLQQDDGSSTGVVVTYNSNSSASDFSPKVDIQWSSVNFTTSALTTTAQVDVTPVVIYSIHFLEVDTSFNIINMDSTYVHGIAIVSGDVFTYTSISATNRGVVPGGMNMVLRGVNANGDLVRNVFTILYTNECGVPTFKEGDAIGWVVFVSVCIIAMIWCVSFVSWCFVQFLVSY